MTEPIRLTFNGSDRSFHRLTEQFEQLYPRGTIGRALQGPATLVTPGSDHITFLPIDHTLVMPDLRDICTWTVEDQTGTVTFSWLTHYRCPCGRPNYRWAKDSIDGLFITHVNDRDGHGMITHHIVDGEIVDEDAAG